MSRTLWVIVEGKNDADIVRAILNPHYPLLRVKDLSPVAAFPNIDHLAEDIEDLIDQALARRKPGDCIVVLHDEDLHTNPNRASYEYIRQVCERHKNDVRLVMARDTIEAWLLADTGFCKWLKIKAQNCDGMKKPKDKLKSRLDKAGKPAYRLENLSKILRYVNGMTSSPKLQEELQYLAGTPCVRE